MLPVIQEVLRANGPLPVEVLIGACQTVGVTVTEVELVAMADRDDLTCFEVERPDDGVFLIFSHPRARVRCRNFR